jgi:hypothetical protein
MQPGISTRGKQEWRMTLCSYGMAFAPRHQVHLWSVASLAHLRWAHRLGCYLAGLFGRVRVGLAPGPPLNYKLRLLCLGWDLLGYLFPYQLKASRRRDYQASGCGAIGVHRGAAAAAAIQGAVGRIRPHLPNRPNRPRMAKGKGRYPCMGEVGFRVPAENAPATSEHRGTAPAASDDALQLNRPRLRSGLNGRADR